MSFYITTPIYYVNDVPHIGHAYTTIVADVLTRYHKLFKEQTFFLTGTDEHGQKVERAAAARGVPPQQHCDELSKRFENIWKELEIDYNFFIRTTMGFHKKVVQDCLTELHEKGDIYIQEYEGWYAVSEEVFYTEKDLVNGKSPQGNEVQRVKEKNYFFKMSKYQKQLIEYIHKNPTFIQPDYRKNEVLGFLAKPLEDLCISRPKARLSWGIEIPFDRDYVTYVWFDALINYVSGIGLKQKGKEHQFNELWPDAVHLIGKDILITHSIYWPTMLMALGLPLPKMIFAHGWWLTKENEKMSKSKGKAISPLDMKDVVGVDGLRYFFTRDIHLGNDAQFSEDLVISRVNTELANNLGNLFSRTTQLITKYFNGSVPANTQNIEATKRLVQTGMGTADKVKAEIKKMAPNLAIGHIVDLLNEANKYLEETAPWKSAKTNLAAAGESLYHSLEAVRISAILLSPVMPQKTEAILTRMGWDKELEIDDARKWGALKPGTAIQKGDPLFPRIETKD